MADNWKDLQGLLTNSSESLDLELKAWIDPDTSEGKAKIAKGCLALRNNDGGRLLIGIQNDGKPDKQNIPADVRITFHADVVQGIVSAYSSEPFPVSVTFPELDGQPYPVITVPSGVRTPVAAKASLRSSDGSKDLINDHAVYVRSMTSNGTVSSSLARRGDWERLTRICFDNREADIGGFVRRHLAGLNLESLAGLVPAFAALMHQPTTPERALTELNQGRTRFDAAVLRRNLQLPSNGYRESIIIVNGTFPVQTATTSFRNQLLVNAPSHTGWPPWVHISGGKNDNLRPDVLDNGWEALLDALDPATAIISPHLDFWRMEPRGVFYHLRMLEDDLMEQRGMTPRTQLDFLLQISRTAEIISTGLSFGRSLECDVASTSLVFGFRWTQLQGRVLSSWVEPGRMFRTVRSAIQDNYFISITVPLETPPSGIAPHVENVVRGLFALFEGQEFDQRVIEEIVASTIRRRM